MTLKENMNRSLHIVTFLAFEICLSMSSLIANQAKLNMRLDSIKFSLLPALSYAHK